MILYMPRHHKKDEWESSPADNAKQRALYLVQEIKKKLEELEPLLSDGALDEEEQPRDAG